MTVKKKIKIKANICNQELSRLHIGRDNIDTVLSNIVRSEIAPAFIVVDLFCGAGGTTTGFEMSNGVAKVIACVNHDPIAIISHWRNHPHVLHFEEDIRTLDLYCLQRITEHYRNLYPNAKLILWASLECTNFSKAKGGQPRDADSRTLANYLHRYVSSLGPDYIQIENVVEFMSWGPLDENGKPISRKNGEDWLRWRKEICDHGYTDDWKQLNSADFGAYTSRNRLFGCFAKHGLSVIWPEPTHAKNPKGGMFSDLKKWKPVKDVLDFEDEGQSIFNRRWNEQLRKQDRKELVEASLKRIYEGLIKHVAGGKDKFMVKYNSMSQKGKYVPPSVDEPCPVIPTQNRLGIAFITKYFSGKPEHKNISIEEPAGTIRTKDGQYLVQCPFIVQRNSGNPESKIASVDSPARTLTSTGGNQELVQPNFLINYNHSSKSKDVDTPAPTLVTHDKLAKVQTDFLMKYYGNGDNTESIESPAGTIPCADVFSKVHTAWLDKQYSGSDNHQSIEQPAGAILGNDKHALMQSKFIDRNFSSGGGKNSSVNEPAGSITSVPKMNIVNAKFLTNMQFDNKGTSMYEPAPTLSASRHYYYIVNPSHGGHSTSIENPCVVLIARQDKSPLYLMNVVSESSPVLIPVYDDDCETMIKIKEFMAMYGISDIKMRMLKVIELKRIQGFPENYHLAGSQADQKKFIGNSVEPHVPQYWVMAMADKLIKNVA